MKGVYHSNDLTFASSIAYYSLLSLFPFFLLALSILASVTGAETDRASVLGFVLRYFPRQFDFCARSSRPCSRPASGAASSAAS